MKRILVIGLLILTLISVPLFAAACEEEEPPPAQQEEEEEEEEEEGNWWDKWGEPQYGGTLTVRADQLSTVTFDPSEGMGGAWQIWLELLFFPDWTLDRNIFPFNMGFYNEDYYQGLLAESWEQTDPLTVTVRLKQGIHWPNVEPVNGREFTAYDVQYHYDRILGTGSGFTEPNPFAAGQIPDIEQVVATDNYTIVFQLKRVTAMGIFQVLGRNANGFECPEVADLYGADPSDPRNAVGTGPWMLEEWDSGVSLTFSRNPDYWGYDERYPENQLPYLDQIKFLAIADMTTAIAALRTGQIDQIANQRGGVTVQQAANLAESNPEIQQAFWPVSGYSVDLRCDVAPFDDIRVRQALQMSIDRTEIAETHYLGIIDGTPCGLIYPGYEGFCIPYDQWPTELQQIYSYNPERARELLAEAAADNVFEPNDLGGFDAICLASTADDLQLLQIIRTYFLDIGVDMEIDQRDIATFMSMIMTGKHDQMAFYLTTAPQFGPLEALGARATGGFLNITYNNDSTYDSMYSECTNATSMDEIKRLIAELDLYAIEQCCAVQILPNLAAILWLDHLKGYSGEQIAKAEYCGSYYARLWID